MDEIPPDLIDVEPRFAELLGLSIEDVKALTVRELVDRAYDRGLTLSVSSKWALEGQGHLKLGVTLVGQKQPAG